MQRKEISCRLFKGERMMVKDHKECVGCHKVQSCNMKPKYFDKECPCSTCIVKVSCTEAKVKWRAGCNERYHYVLWSLMLESDDDYTREKSEKEILDDT